MFVILVNDFSLDINVLWIWNYVRSYGNYNLVFLMIIKYFCFDVVIVLLINKINEDNKIVWNVIIYFVC